MRSMLATVDSVSYNVVIAADVNLDSSVSPSDVFAIIGLLRADDDYSITVNVGDSFPNGFLPDVNNDWLVNAADVYQTVTAVIGTSGELPNVWVAPLRDTVEGGLPGVVLFGRTGSTTAALDVYFELSGSADVGDDFVAPETDHVTIPAGHSMVEFVLPPINDAANESTESIIVGLTDDPGDPTYNIPEPFETAEISLADNDPGLLPMVYILSTTTTAIEADETPGVITVYRTGLTADALTVHIAISGTAQNGVDYQTLATTVEFAANQSSADISIVPTGDPACEGNETVQVALVASPDYYIYADDRVAGITLVDDDPSEVSVSTSGSPAEWNTASGAFLVTRTGPTTAELVVQALLGGDATSADDFDVTGSNVEVDPNDPTLLAITFPVGVSQVSVGVAPIDDVAVEGTEDVSLELQADTSNPVLYVLGTNTASFDLTDSDWGVSIEALGDGQAFEAYAIPGQYRLTRTGPIDFSQPLTVLLEISPESTASIGDHDFELASVEIPAGEQSVIVGFTPTDDNLVEFEKSLIVAIGSDPGYTVLGSGSATITIVSDNETSILIDLPTDALPLNTDDDDGNEVPDVDDEPGVLAENNLLPVGITQDFDLAQFNAGFVSLSILSGSEYLRIWDSPEKTNELVGGASWQVGTDVIPSAVYVEGLEEGAAVLALTLQDATETLVVQNERQINVVSMAPEIAIERVWNADEANEQPGKVRVIRYGDATFGMTVHYTLQLPETVEQTDFEAPSGVVYFAAGQVTADIELPPLDDAAVEGPETVAIVLLPDIGYTVMEESNQAVIAILDNEPQIFVSAAAPVLSETDGATNVLVVRRTGDLASSLTVPFTVDSSGTNSATSGVDYEALSGSVYFAANVDEVEVSISPLVDGTAEDAETIVLVFASDLSAGYSVDPEDAQAIVVLADAAPYVSIVAGDNAPSELELATGVFTVRRDGGDLSAALVVQYTVTTSGSGLATPDSDYEELSGSVEIPANEEYATITITPIADSLVEGFERVHIALAAASAYHIAPQAFEAELLLEDGASVVSLGVVVALASEDDDNPAEFIASRTGDLSQELSVAFTLDTTSDDAAEAGVDFETLSGTVVFGIGEATAPIIVTPIDDSLPESLELVRLVLSAGAAYTVSAVDFAAEALLADNEPTVSLEVAAGAAGESGANGRFIVSRAGGDNSAALTVYLEIDSESTATYGSSADYLFSETFTAGAGSVVIAAGEDSAEIFVTPVQDAAAEDSETVLLKLVAGSTPNYVLGAQTSGEVSIADDEPSITVLGVQDAQEEDPATGLPVDGLFVLTRSGDLSSSYTVDLEVFAHASYQNAALDTDYTLVAMQATFAEDESEVEIVVTPLVHTYLTGPRFLGLTVDPGGAFHVADDEENFIFVQGKLKLNLTGYRPGTMAAPGTEVPELVEEDPKQLALMVNDDADDPPPTDPLIQDNQDNVARPNDNDLVRLKIDRPFIGTGTLQFRIENLPASVRVFDSTGQALSLPLTVDLANPSGPLAGLAAGEVELYLEGLEAREDVKAVIEYQDGTVTLKDEVHFNLARVNLAIAGLADAAEDDAGTAGQWLPVNNGDEDKDGIPNYADNLDSLKTDLVPGILAGMTVVTVTIEGPIDFDKATIRFDYPAANPAELMAVNTIPLPSYSPWVGALTLWNKDTMQAGRRRAGSASVGQGDFIPSSINIPVSNLGFSSAHRTLTLFAEGLNPSAGIGVDQINVTVRNSGIQLTDSALVTVGTVDLDIDSDNTATPFGAPATFGQDRHIEDHLEMVGKQAGKLIPVNTDDADNDKWLDLADGFSLGTHAQSAANKSAAFTPIEVTIPDPIDLATATISFAYNQSLPYLAVKGLPLQGDIRLWTKDGTAARNGAAVSGGGDFLITSTQYSPAALGFTSASRTQTFYVEGIQATNGTGSIEVMVSPGSSSSPVKFVDEVQYSVYAFAISGKIEYDTAFASAKPVREARVEVWSNKLVGATFTNDDGTYSLALPFVQAGYSSLTIKVFAESKQVDANNSRSRLLVVPNETTKTAYSISFTPPSASMPLLNTREVIANHVIGATNNAEKAFWIFDAALTGSRMQSLLPGASVVRPRIGWEYGASQASGGNFILDSADYNSWDTILHEYGHTIQTSNGFWSYTGSVSDHSTNTNVRLTNPTGLHSNVLQRAFSEGFANFFSMLAQHEIGVSSPPVFVNANEMAGDNKLYQNDVESSLVPATDDSDTKGYGEDEEVSIMRILWDLYDPALPGGGDRVEMGYARLFSILKDNTIQTLDELWDVLGADAGADPQKLIDNGAIFQFNGVSPSPAGNVLTKVGVPPKFSWDVPQDSNHAGSLLKDFGIKLFDGNLELFDSGLLGKKAHILPGGGAGGVDRMTWTPLLEVWKTMNYGAVFETPGHYRWIVYGIDLTPSWELGSGAGILTGEYWSDARDLDLQP